MSLLTLNDNKDQSNSKKLIVSGIAISGLKKPPIWSNRASTINISAITQQYINNEVFLSFTGDAEYYNFPIAENLQNYFILWRGQFTADTVAIRDQTDVAATGTFIGKLSGVLHCRSGGVNLITSVSLVNNKTYTILLKASGTNTKLYLDGKLIQTATTGTNPLTTKWNLHKNGNSVDSIVRKTSLCVVGKNLSDALAYKLSKEPWQIFERDSVPFYFDTGTSGSTTLTQSTRFNNSNSFYAPTVSAGAVSLLPPAISNSQSIYAPTVTVGSVTLSANRLNNSNAFYSPTLSAGGVALLPGILNNANTIYAPIVTTGALSIVQSSRFNNGNVIYSASLTPGSVTLSPSLFSNTETLYPPVVTNGGTLIQQSSRLDNANTFYGPVITTGTVTLTASLFDNSETFYSATVSAGSISLLPSLFSNASLIYGPVVTQGAATLLPDLLTNANVFYGHAVTTGQVTLVVSLFNNAQSFFSPTVTTVEPQTLVQSSVFENGNIFYVPRVSEGLTLSPADIEAIADAVWARALDGLRADEMVRIMFAALAGKREGLGTATEFYMAQDGVTPRITLTPDQYGNGTPIVNGGA